jgi:serine/threonine-protein phosphatase 5
MAWVILKAKGRFKRETESKYDCDVYRAFSRLFCALPLAGLVQKQIFVVHGGLSHDPFTLEDVLKIDRFVDSPEKCLMANLLWSDVINEKGLKIGRGESSIQFGPDIAEEFLRLNNLTYLVRSHEKKDKGYELHPGGKLITVFSAPNYCDEDQNEGAVLNIPYALILKPEVFQFSAAVGIFV